MHSSIEFSGFKPLLVNTYQHIAILADEQSAISYAAEYFIALAQLAIRERGLFTVALSGGSTPQKLFQTLAQPPYINQIDWTHVAFFWSDERAVMPDHRDSNYRMAMQCFQHTPITQAQFFRMQAESDIERHAQEYERLIKTQCKDGLFDLVYLGVGDDGHTASLFPGTQGLEVKNHLVIANYIPQKDTWRMSLTFDGIHHSRAIHVLAWGASKSSILPKILIHPQGVYPAEKIGTSQHPALFILDQAAAAELKL